MLNAVRKIAIIIAVLIFCAGAALFLYPYITKTISDRAAAAAIAEFKSEIASAREESAEADDGSLPFQELYDAMYQYNIEIYQNGQSGLKDQYSYQASLFNLSEYGIDSDVFGYINIPKMEVSLPIYLGASKENMTLGAVHLTYTSMPLDQDNTNVVIAAHRSYRGAEFFRYIDKLEIGDTITVATPWNTLTYSVTETKIIEKDDIEAIYIQSGKSLLTLSTCHPYTQTTYRYLVYAELISADN